MERYVSNPSPVPTLVDTDLPADLIFFDLRRAGRTFRANVFFNAPDAGVDTPLSTEAGYVGSMTVLGLGACLADDGCEPRPPLDEFDIRMPLGFPRVTKTIVVPSAALARLTGDTFTITVLAVVPSGSGPRLVDELDFVWWRLVTYEH
ncbi:MAG: hypothetical protein M3321_08790 [Actinomycetota bacterium]|nr:hypothetical protein [Actinomycetota bacterium]